MIESFQYMDNDSKNHNHLEQLIIFARPRRL